MIHRQTQHEGKTLHAFFDAKMRLIEHATAYMHYVIEKNDREATHATTAASIAHFLRHLEQTPYLKVPLDRALVLVSDKVIKEWIKEQRTPRPGRPNGLSDRTIHNREVILHEMYKRFVAIQLIERNPWVDGLITRGPKRGERDFVTAERLIKILLGLHNESQRCWAHFMYDTGARISELCRYTVDCLPQPGDWPSELPYLPLIIPGSKPIVGSIKPGLGIISRPMLARIRKYHNSDPAYINARGWPLNDPKKPIFLNVHGGPLKPDSARDSLQAACRRQNVKGTPPHVIRHGTGFSVLRSELGKDITDNLAILRAQLNHEDIQTTEIYAHILQAIIGLKKVVRHEEAAEIFEATYLKPRAHKEKRGHNAPPRTGA